MDSLLYRVTQNAMCDLLEQMEGRWREKEYWEEKAARYNRMREWAEKRWSWAGAYNLDRFAHWNKRAYL